MPNILHVTPWFPPHKGGISNYVSNLSSRLSEMGYGVSILTVKKVGEKVGQSGPSKYKNILYSKSLYLPGWPYPTLRSVSIPLDAGLKMNSIIKEGNFDIVHAHGIHYPLSWLSMYLAHKHGIRTVLSLHGTYALNPNALSGETLLERLLYRHIFSRVLSKTDAVIGPAQYVTSLAKSYCKCASTSFFTIGYGIQTQRFVENLGKRSEYRNKFKIKDDAIVVLFSGRFEQVKGILEFSRAVKKLVKDAEKVEVIIVGAGSLSAQVNMILERIPEIHLFEWQPEEKIHEFYIASDIFVIPSRFEGLPLTVLEAMTAGLHIVYTPVGGIPEILKEYQAKTALREISDREIYSILVSLVDIDLNITDEKQLIRYAMTFDWSSILIKINDIYEQITS
jgi:phosphatidylinositol alpha-mannosyltransferase